MELETLLSEGGCIIGLRKAGAFSIAHSDYICPAVTV